MAINRKPKPVRKLAPAKRVQIVESSAASVFGPAAAGVQRALAWFGTWRGVRAPRDEIAGVLLLVLGVLGLLGLSGLAAGSWLRLLAQLLQVWMGAGALLLPASALGVGAALFARALGRRFRINWWRVIAAELGMAALLGLLHWRFALMETTVSLRVAVESGPLVDAALAGQGGGKVGWAMLTIAGLLAPEATGRLLGGIGTYYAGEERGIDAGGCVGVRTGGGGGGGGVFWKRRAGGGGGIVGAGGRVEAWGVRGDAGIEWAGGDGGAGAGGCAGEG